MTAASRRSDWRRTQRDHSFCFPLGAENARANVQGKDGQGDDERAAPGELLPIFVGALDEVVDGDREVGHRLAEVQAEELVAEGGGIMDYSHGVYYRDSTISPVANEKEGFKNAGVTIYRADKGSTIQLRVTCWGEQMIPYAFEAYRPQFAKFKSAYPDLNEVDFYTGIKAKQLAVDWLGQLRAYVPKWFKKAGDQAKLLKALKGAKIKMVWFKGGEIKTGVPAMVN